MKKEKKPVKKLTKKDYERMWGENGPYSQVRLCEEIRILDDMVSRVFLVVEASINPFVFEYVKKHRRIFASDAAISQLLNRAEFRGIDFGYVANAGETELRDEESFDFAQKQTEMATQTIIRMHSFVMEEFNLRKNKDKYCAIKESPLEQDCLVWDKETGEIKPVDGAWEDETIIGNPAGVKNNKMRFFIVLAFENNVVSDKKFTDTFIKTLKKVSALFKVEIEYVESFQRYVLITVLLPFDVAPASFAEGFLSECNSATKKLFFKNDYLITNVKRPTPKQIFDFLGGR